MEGKATCVLLLRGYLGISQFYWIPRTSQDDISLHFHEVYLFPLACMSCQHIWDICCFLLTRSDHDEVMDVLGQYNVLWDGAMIKCPEH